MIYSLHRGSQIQAKLRRIKYHQKYPVISERAIGVKELYIIMLKNAESRILLLFYAKMITKMKTAFSKNPRIIAWLGS